MAIGGWEVYAVGWGITIVTTVGGLLLHASYLKGKFSEQIDSNRRSIETTRKGTDEEQAVLRGDIKNALSVIETKQTKESCADFRRYIGDSIAGQTTLIERQMENIVSRIEKLNNHAACDPPSAKRHRT